MLCERCTTLLPPCPHKTSPCRDPSGSLDTPVTPDHSKFLFRGTGELLDVLPRGFLGTKVPHTCIYEMSPGGKEIKPRQKLLLLQESQWNIFFLIKIFQKEKLVWNAY